MKALHLLERDEKNELLERLCRLIRKYIAKAIIC